MKQLAATTKTSGEIARIHQLHALDGMNATTTATSASSDWAATARFGIFYSSLAGGVAYALNQRLDHNGKTTLFIMVFTVGFFTSWIRTMRG